LDGLFVRSAGAIDPGAAPAQAVAREVYEETGLQVQVGRVLGVVGGAASSRNWHTRAAPRQPLVTPRRSAELYRQSLVLHRHVLDMPTAKAPRSVSMQCEALARRSRTIRGIHWSSA